MCDVLVACRCGMASKVYFGGTFPRSLLAVYCNALFPLSSVTGGNINERSLWSMVVKANLGTSCTLG